MLDKEIAARNVLAQQEKSFKEQLAAQKVELERIHAEKAQSYQSHVNSVGQELIVERQNVSNLQQELGTKNKKISELEELRKQDHVDTEGQKQSAQSQDQRVQELQQKLDQLNQQLNDKSHQVRTLQQRLAIQEQVLIEKTKLAAELQGIASPFLASIC